ncbi:MAG: hypothetical protein U5N53_11415 [Mycobacterium sp.]|nr:hypothetical protein [Mycobacterium sp.]
MAVGRYQHHVPGAAVVADGDDLSCGTCRQRSGADAADVDEAGP